MKHRMGLLFGAALAAIGGEVASLPAATPDLLPPSPPKKRWTKPHQGARECARRVRQMKRWL